MKLSQLLLPELILVPMEAADKWQAISVMAKAAVAAGALAGELLEGVESALVERETSMTTGMEHGIAIPHAAVDRIEDVIAVL